LVQVPEFRRRSDLVEFVLDIAAMGRAFVIVAALIALSWAFRRMRRESAGQLEQLLAAQLKTRTEIQTLAEKVSALATLVAATRDVRPVESPRPAPRREPSPVRSYETARRLARSGATVEEIVATCGVAGSEARLLQRLHGAASLDKETAA
jgi:hypothetical protein